MSAPRKRVTRTFSACWTCRRRRVKCNGNTPSCTPCLKRGVRCDGYGIELAWVDPVTGAYPPLSRRSRDLAHTWRGCPVLSDQQLQRLINGMDGSDCSRDVRETNPFFVFTASEPASVDSSPSDDSLTLLCPSPRSIPRSMAPTTITPSTPDDAAIFHHYMTWVASLMIPVDSDANPWKSVYPSTALKSSSPASRSLYHAMLAQSAFNLANLYEQRQDIVQKATARALEHYGASLRQLAKCLDSSTAEEYDACMATLYTLVVTEVRVPELVVE